jgi:hypothetical protein
MSLPSNDGDTVATEESSDFSLHWTVGFAGKRQIAPARESAVHDALARALDFLWMKAVDQGASLTAVSSIARGGDLIFAEAALGKGHRRKWPWKCVLPFPLNPFLDNDLGDLPEPERAALRRRATDCVQSATTLPIVTSPGTDVSARAQREEAYLDCGYRIVDEADVVIVLLNGQEFADFDQASGSSRPPVGPGSAAVARYAIAARHPTILLDADAPDPWEARRIYNDPEAKPVREEFFHDGLVTPLVEDSLKKAKLPPAASGDEVWSTPNTRAVAHLLNALGVSADTHQSSTIVRLRLVLTMHLLATAIAATLATVLAEVGWVERLLPRYAAHALWAIAALAALKPLLAAYAFLVEKQLHREGSRETWTRARVLAELCRGALAMWPLPQQPLDAQDEEDFPRVKRLLRTLRLMREQDSRVTVPAPRSASEPQIEADMRVACDRYIVSRLNNQIDYYRDKKELAAKQSGRWRLAFRAATLVAILLGTLLLVPEIHHAWVESDHAFDALPFTAFVATALVTVFAPVWHALHFVETFEHLFQALLIIAPFVAAYSLATMSLLDCRRRERRYAEMAHFLERTRDTLSRTESNASRLRLIEQAERSLIEEQHEWFSVMRNLNV